jgi:hypothetical protein
VVVSKQARKRALIGTHLIVVVVVRLLLLLDVWTLLVLAVIIAALAIFIVVLAASTLKDVLIDVVSVVSLAPTSRRPPPILEVLNGHVLRRPITGEALELGMDLVHLNGDHVSTMTSRYALDQLTFVNSDPTLFGSCACHVFLSFRRHIMTKALRSR